MMDIEEISGRAFQLGWKTHKELTEPLIEALEKISDPTKREHVEKDTHTDRYCIMNIAKEALEKYND